jgi:uracil-DNA glycosylase family 4|tara:strand:+ start:967 stop:1641 length:675 start_codon:yes stop_codon:yes gene_type:complete
MNVDFLNLNKKITNCNKCPRLVKFRDEISLKKRKQNSDEIYWGKPVTGFGDTHGKMLILGLAPAAHGGTRTGRAFTGDKSGDFLFKCLFSAKISNQPISKNIDDGLELNSTYITNILKCVPPGDKPYLNELNNCSVFFDNEILKLKNLRVIITLGKVAFDNCIKFYKKKYQVDKRIIFKHGKKYTLPDGKFLIPCYHPSPRNVNTKIINLKMMKNLFLKAKKLI